MLGRSAILAVLLLALAPAAVPAASLDATSTHTYIAANYTFVQASDARVRAAQADIIGLIHRFKRECPKVGAGAPQNEEAQKLSYEVAGAIWSVAYGADAGPIRAFIRAVRPLRWSNPALTRAARGYARSLHELASLPVPDLCGDVHAWSTSGFRIVAATTTRFDLHVESIEGHSIAPRLLAPYERPSDRSILERTTRLETKLEHVETVTGFNDWGSLLETLGLNQ
jgi:hypothetical protein